MDYEQLISSSLTILEKNTNKSGFATVEVTVEVTVVVVVVSVVVVVVVIVVVVNPRILLLKLGQNQVIHR